MKGFPLNWLLLMMIACAMLVHRQNNNNQKMLLKSFERITCLDEKFEQKWSSSSCKFLKFVCTEL